MVTTYKAPGVYIEEAPSVAPIVGVGTSTPAFIGIFSDPPLPAPPAPAPLPLVAAKVVVPCTNFTEFAAKFGGFSDPTTPGQNTFAHAVRGFFTNGGTHCYAVRVAQESDIPAALEKLEPYDDISMVAAPGVTSATAAGQLADHCKLLRDRIAILDAPNKSVAELLALLPTPTDAPYYKTTDFAALYTPWLQVYDPTSKGPIDVPPSGFIAGIYARTDAHRGVHKAPANETVLGAIDASIKIGRAQQATINLQGANCIRVMGGALKVWGARTLAGDLSDRSHFKYIPIRRLMSFLYKSIDQGTQWAVFEPNGPDLWAKIVRNVGSFLSGIWAQGALAGTVPQEAFFVKCDAENNPPDQRANGLLVVEVGVAVLYPAEFVVFKIQHQSALAK